VPPEQPEWLTAAAAEIWQRLVPDLAAMGTVFRCDELVLAAYCEAGARLQTSADMVARTGLVIRDRDGNARKNPAVAMERDATADVRMLARELGLSPSARSGIRVTVRHEGLPGERLLS
jgi:P27 family predicted phage terminase small subunit